MFVFAASFSPAELAAAPNSGLSVAYAGAVDASTPNETFTVLQVPEPSVAALFFLGLLGWFLIPGRRPATLAEIA
jgi:hypothetical protein